MIYCHLWWLNKLSHPLVLLAGDSRMVIVNFYEIVSLIPSKRLSDTVSFLKLAFRLIAVLLLHNEVVFDGSEVE